jgi:hypothetical protein
VLTLSINSEGIPFPPIEELAGYISSKRLQRDEPLLIGGELLDSQAGSLNQKSQNFIEIDTPNALNLTR